MRKILTSFLAIPTFLSVNAQTYSFFRTDTVPVIHINDTLSHSWAGGMNFCQFSQMDFNFDGIKDLFVFDRTGNQVLTFINSGIPNTIQYTYAPEYEKIFPADINSWCLLRDYNCDGKEDIFTYKPGGIGVYKNVTVGTNVQWELVTSLLKSTQCLNYVNIYVSSVDIASIDDVDYDGDLDILTFGIFGNTVEYHKNLSIEGGYGCDTLLFYMKNQQWGHFSESSSNCSINLNVAQTNCPQLGGPEMPIYPGLGEIQEFVEFRPDTHEFREILRHTGSALLSLDMNGINSKELLVSDVSCTQITMLTNSGASANLNSPMNAKDTAFPSNSIPVDMQIFPAPYHLDIDNDSIRDLLVSPNITTQALNADGNWLYKNNGTDLFPDFDYVQDAFMQDQMFEQGEGSIPVFFDYNDDGKMDLVVSNYGFFTTGGIYESRLALYENVGTLTEPALKLVNQDFENLYSVIGQQSLHPTFGDLDGDGDKDMIVGDDEGNLHRFTNTAGIGNPANFTTTQLLMTDITAATIDIGQTAAPILVDIDRDNDLDLIIGEKNANLNYYQNIGTSASPQFKFVTDTFGSVKVNEYWTILGFSAPSFYEVNGKYHMFIGSQKGVVYEYDSIDGNLTGEFRRLDSLCWNHKIGIRTVPTVASLNNDTLPEIVVGNYRGGLTYYTTTSLDTSIVIPVTEEEVVYEDEIEIFPNPASGQLFIRYKGKADLKIHLTDLSSRILMNEKRLLNAQQQIDISALSNGLYFVHFTGENGNILMTRKFVKQN